MSNEKLVQSVVAANLLLEALSRKPGGSSLSELSRDLGMTPSRVLRHLGTLVELRLIERTGTEPQYRLGVKLIQLAERAQRQHDITRLAYPALQRLSASFGQATYLARRDGARSLVWLSLQGEGAPHLTMPPGMWSSLTGSATGRVLLAFDPEAQVEERFAKKAEEGYPDPVPNEKALRARLDLIRAQCFDYHGVGEANAIYTLAAPILDHRERAVAVIAVAGFSIFFPQHGESLLAALSATAQELSRTMGSGKIWPPARIKRTGGTD